MTLKQQAEMEEMQTRQKLSKADKVIAEVKYTLNKQNYAKNK